MTREDFYAVCISAIAKVKRLKVEEVKITPATNFAVYGLDSLDVMNFLLEIEQSSGLSLGEVDMKTYSSMEKLYDFVVPPTPAICS